MKDLKENVMAWLMDEASDDEIYELVCNIDCYNGSLEELRFYWMEDLNDLFCGVKPTELLEKLADGFRVSDEGFKCTIWGLDSCSYTDAVQDMKDNTNDIIEGLMQDFDEIDLPDGLKNYLEEIDLEDNE